MNKGKVKFFDEKKGFGFITDDKSKKDLFVHFSSIGKNKIRQGDRVSYDIKQTERGTQAVGVVLEQ